MKGKKETQTKDLKLPEQSEDDLSLVTGGSEAEIGGSGLFIPTPVKPANPRKIAEE